MTLARLAMVPLVVVGVLAASCEAGETVSSTAVYPTVFSTSAPERPAGPFTPAAVYTEPAGIDTSRLVPVLDPLSGDNPRYPEEALALPPVGAAFQDAGLETPMVRVTERPGVRHEYSRFDPLNTDKSMIVLLDDGFKVFRTTAPYDRQENLVRVLDLEDPRWDRTDPNLILGLSGFRIVGLNVLTGQQVTVKDFATDPTIGPLIEADKDLYRITMKNEGETSWDGRWWAFALQASGDDYRLRYLFCWDRSADEVVGFYELGHDQADIDWLGVSPLGTWVLIGAEPHNHPPLAGFVIANRELTEFHQIDWATSHSDVGIDVNGREVLVMQNPQTDHIELLPLAPSTRPLSESEARYEGTGHIPLVRLFYADESPIGFDCGLHISCNAPGYALVSTYQEPGRPERSWLDRSIILVRLDPGAPEAYLVAKIHNVTQEYWEETHATISNDGRTVVWAANFGVDPGSLNTYLLRLELP